MRGARLWFRLEVAGHAVPFYVVKPGHAWLKEGEGTTYDGIYDPEEGRVVIAQGPVPVMKETAIHEAFHVWFEKSGVTHTVMGGSSDKEEKLIRTLTPHIYGSLTSSRMLRLPNPPRLP